LENILNYRACRASERCQQEKRKTINGEDILFAMTTLGFDNYVEPLKVYLTKYREVTIIYTYYTKCARQDVNAQTIYAIRN